MENINIAIVTDDRNYGRAIGYAILNVCRTLIVSVFNKDEFATEQGNLNSTTASGRFSNGLDIVMYDGEDKPDNICCSFVRLVEKPSMACRCTENGRYSIYKYTPAQELVSQLFEIYSKETGRMTSCLKKENVHIMAFNSYCGGTGATTIAMAVCQELARFYKQKVLYISLEELESTGCYIDGPSSVNSMSYYLYGLFKSRGSSKAALGNEEFRPFIESYIIKDDFGVEAFKPTKGRNPLAALSAEEICIFIESIISLGRYDAIAMDVGVNLSPAAIACTEMAEKICLVCRKSPDNIRETHYLQYLVGVGGQDILHKMIKIQNMCEYKHNSFLDDEDNDSMIDTKLYIEKDNIYSEESHVLKVLLEGDFGQNITKLTNMIIEPLE